MRSLEEYLPAVQSVQIEAPAKAEMVPVPQFWQKSLPVPEAYVPARQLAHDVWPAAEYSPDEHMEHDTVPGEFV
jgi:hypothetical protein